MHYFVVYSPKEYSEDAEKALMWVTNLELIWASKEFGKAGDHPHLNLLYTCSETVRKDNLKRKLYGLLNSTYKQAPHLLQIKNARNLPGLACYFTKEEGHELLFEHEAYPLKEYIAKNDFFEERFFSSQASKGYLTAITECEVIERAIGFFTAPPRDGDSFEIDISNPAHFKAWQARLVQDGYYCQRISWTRVYNYVQVYIRGEHSEEYPRLWDV